MSTSNLPGVNVESIISSLAGANAGTGVIGGYCEDGFPLFYANQAMVDMLGYDSLDDFTRGINGLVANTIHPDDMAQVNADLGDDWREGDTYQTQYRMPRKDGSWFWTVDRGEFVRAQDGRLAIISVCSDMTEFMQRHAELEKKNLVSESMLDSLPGGYHRCANDSEYTFLYVGRRFCEMLGWTEDELREKFDYKFMNLVHPDDRHLTTEYVETISKATAEAKEGEPSQYHEQVYRLASKNDGYRWVTDSSIEMHVDGQTMYQGFITDITPFYAEQERRRQQAEEAALEAERANASKTSFLRHMSHDIRTPLNGIIGMIEMSERFDDDPEKRAECRRKMLYSSNYLLSLVNNILDMNKLESGLMEVENEPFDLVEMLMEQLTVIGSLAGEAGVQLLGGRESSTVVHRHLVGSRTYLNRVLMNLASNAVKYNKPGGTLTITATELSCEGDTVYYQFICEDTGIGMSEEFQKHAFEAFTQEERAAQSAYTGTGLGLAIAKELTELIGGTIEMESVEGKGTKFTMVFPFKIDAARHLRNMGQREHVDLNGKHALLVEDNDLNAEIAQMILSDMGISTEVANDGAQAVEAFKAAAPGTFDLVFMDIMMPVMNGLDATRAIRALERDDAKTTPVLAMTANAFQDDVRASLDAGMNGHITKPLNREQIEEAVENALAKMA